MSVFISSPLPIFSLAAPRAASQLTERLEQANKDTAQHCVEFSRPK